MCLLGLAFRESPEFPILVLANREEFYARPTASPQIFPREGAAPAWMGGTDLVAGGTWLGVNELGMVVAVTNRPKTQLPENPPSRGLLCRRLLAHYATASALELARDELQANKYAGCNLLIADRETAYVVEAGDELKLTQLTPGLHLLTNAELNAPDDLRIARVRRELAQARSGAPAGWFENAERICRLSGDGGEVPICLVGPDRGTVSSTVIGLGRDLFDSRYLYAPGPPQVTPYEDFTPLLKQLLAGWAGLGTAGPPDAVSSSAKTAPRSVPDIEPPDNSPARRAMRQNLEAGGVALQVPDLPADSPYRILLRGPWQSEPLSRATLNPDGTVAWSQLDLPPHGTVRLPAFWQELFGAFRGRVRFRRKFHPPSNIAAEDRLAIVFTVVGGGGEVALNGSPLGRIEPGSAATRFDVTGRLMTNNDLSVDLEFIDFSPAPPPGGLFTPVALEIM
ncbi:MAG: NRDE family protein [Planctomycetia bacterium]|nr:NRDE family protein [Planctomycetia bacterium]